MNISLPMIKLVVQVVSGFGVSKVVNDIITNNTNVVTVVDKIAVWTGSVVIGSMTAHAVTKHVDEIVDTIASKRITVTLDEGDSQEKHAV